MTALWKVRHEGSPTHVELPLVVLQQGLLDAEWELTDEVLGPGETKWRVIEEHPAFEELALEIEEPPPAQHDEEGHLDMNALIDVCMVLLIFFILTTSVAALQKQMEAPDGGAADVRPAKITKERVQQQMIVVEANLINGEPVILIGIDATEKDGKPTVVGGEEISLDALGARIRGYATATRTDLLLIHDDFVSQDVVLQIIDKAKAAGVNKIQVPARSKPSRK